MSDRFSLRVSASRLRKPKPTMRVVAALVLVVTSANAQTADDLAALKRNTAPMNAHLVRSLGGSAAATLETTAYKNVVTPTPTEFANMGPTIQQIAQQTVRANENHDTGLAILKGNNRVISTSIGIGMSLGGSPVLGGIVGTVVDAGLEKVTDIYRAEAEESIRRNLKTNLEEYRRRTSEQQFQQLLNAPTPAAFRNQLEQTIGGVFGTALDGLPREQQDIVNSFYNKELANVMKGGFAAVAEFQELQATEIAQNRKNIAGLAQAFTQFADETRDRFVAIENTQKALVQGLDDVNKRVGNAEQGIAVMQDLMFSKLSPREQLVALKTGFFPNMPQEAKEELEARINVVARRQELVEQVSGYLNGAGHLATIAGNLGVDPAIVGKANQAIDIGNKAVAAFAAFSTGNVLAGISSISSVFGVGGPDVAGQRHQEIMDTLRGMYEKINVIDKKIDILLEGQKTIIANQAIILQSITTLADQVERNHDAVVNQLHEVHGDVLYNRQLIRTEAALHYAQCRKIVFNDNDGTRFINTEKRSIPAYTVVERVYTDRRNALVDCIKQLDNIREAGNMFRRAIFAFETYKDTPESNVKPYLDTMYVPALALVTATAITQDGNSVAERLTSLLSPVGTLEGLDGKLATLTVTNPPRLILPLSTLMQVPLAVDAVLQHDEYVTDVHYYYLLLSPEDVLRPHAELYRASSLRMSGRDRLIEALALTDVAIAQQTMLSGDALLPVLYQAITQLANASTATDQFLHQQAVSAIEHNAILAKNFVLYAMRRDVRSASNILAYNVALQGTDIPMLQSVTSTRWQFAHHAAAVMDGNRIKIPAGWSVAIGNADIALPTADQLLEGRLTTHDEVGALLAQRRRILDELTSYDVYTTAPANLRSRVNSVILQQFLRGDKPVM